MNYVYCRPARKIEEQISIDGCRRSELMDILRDNDSREDVGQFYLWRQLF